MTGSEMSLALSVDSVNDEGANAFLWPVNDSARVLIVWIMKLCASFLSHCYIYSLF